MGHVNRLNFHHIRHSLLDSYLQAMKESQSVCSRTVRNVDRRRSVSPVHVSAAPAFVLVYPVLQVQTTALLFLSCEQFAFTSHPPLFTSHASVHTLFEPAPANTYPVLQIHLTALFEVSCEQSALASQPPLFTWQLSGNTPNEQQMCYHTVEVSRSDISYQYR